MIKISLLSPARHNETCEHGGQALCRIVHLFNWHNSTTRTFSAIFNSAKYTFSKIRIPQSAFRKVHLPHRDQSKHISFDQRSKNSKHRKYTSESFPLFLNNNSRFLSVAIVYLCLPIYISNYKLVSLFQLVYIFIFTSYNGNDVKVCLIYRKWPIANITCYLLVICGCRRCRDQNFKSFPTSKFTCSFDYHIALLWICDWNARSLASRTVGHQIKALRRLVMIIAILSAGLHFCPFEKKKQGWSFPRALLSLKFIKYTN